MTTAFRTLLTAWLTRRAQLHQQHAEHLASLASQLAALDSAERALRNAVLSGYGLGCDSASWAVRLACEAIWGTDIDAARGEQSAIWQRCRA